MKTLVPFISWLVLSASHPAIHPPKNHAYINEMLDLVESGIDSPAEGRALFVSITLTSTSTSLATVTMTETVTPSCVAGTFTECMTETDSMSTTTDSMESSMTDSMTDSMTSSATDSMTSSMTDSMTSSATDSMTSSMTDSMTSSATDSMTSSMTDSTTSSATDSMTSSATDSATTSAAATTSATATTSDAATTSATTTSSDSATTSASSDTATTTAAATTRAVELQRSLDDFNNLPSAIVTTSNGETVDINMILPSKVEPLKERADELELFNADGLISEGHNMQSGKIEWNEMAVQGLHTCGRSNIEKRPRFIALQQEQITKNLTSTVVVTETAMETVTFNVQLQQCTTAGFTFAVPQC